MKAERRTTQFGTARKPASRKRASVQPSNLEGTLSHHAAPPGPPAIRRLSLRRNDKSTAFFNHWLTFQEFGPVAPEIFSATLALPEFEQIERPLDRVAHVSGRLRVDPAAVLEGVFDQRLKLCVAHGGSRVAGDGFLRTRLGCQWRGELQRSYCHFA